MTWLLNASFAVMIGALAAMLWLRQSSDVARDATGKRLSSTIGIALAVCAISTLLSLWQAGATMGDAALFDSGAALWAMFTTTHYGHVGIASIVLLGAAALVHLFISDAFGRYAYLMTMLALVALYGVCRVSIGHASEKGLVSAAAGIEWAHLLMMALWIGSVFIAAWIVLPQLAGGETNQAGTKRYLVALSHWATVALAAILATGLYNTYRVLTTPEDLLSTEYGWILTTKIGLVIVAIAMGAWNRFVGFPTVLASAAGPLADGGPLRPVIAVLRVESAVLFIVLGAAAILTSSAPPSAS